MELKYLKNVVTLKLESEKCTGCGICIDVCPRNVFQLKDRKAVISDPDLCIECGACSMNCAFDAISVRAGVGAFGWHAPIGDALMTFSDSGHAVLDPRNSTLISTDCAQRKNLLTSVLKSFWEQMLIPVLNGQSE